jgi:hypothetical protein
MELNTAREATTCAATSEKILSILWNPKVNYRIHKTYPLVPILNQTTPSYLSTNHPNIIHRIASWSS